MKSHFLSKLLIGFLAASLFLTSCQKGTPPSPTETSTARPSTPTMTPSPTHTVTLTSTITPTPEPTPTASPTPTETVQSDDRGLSLTPIPLINEIITVDNTDRVDALAIWGNGKANTIALSPDGQILAIGTGIGVYLYDSQNFRFITLLPTPYSVQSIAFSPDNLSIALGQSQGIIDIYELVGESLTARLYIPDVTFIDPHEVTVLFTQNGAYLNSLVHTNDTIYINLWMTASWQMTEAFAIESGLVSYLNPNAGLIGIINEELLFLQSLSFPEESRAISLPTSEPRSFWEQIPIFDGEVAPSSAGDFILVNNGSTIIRWELTQAEVSYRLDQYPDELPDPCYTAPDSCRNTSGNYSWVCTDDTRIPPIETIVLTPDNTMVFVSRNEDILELRQASNGFLIWEIDARFTKVVFAQTTGFFFGLKPNGGIEKRSIVDGSLVFSLYEHPSQINAMDFSPDNSILAVGFNDNWIRIFSAFNGERLGVLDGSATSLEFSSDGRLLAAGLHDGTIRIFELEEGRFYDLPVGHLDAVTGISFAEDNVTLLTGSHDCTTSVWDLERRYRRLNITPGGTNPFQISTVERASLDQSQYILAKGNGLYQVKDTEITTLYVPPNIAFRDMALSPNQRQVVVIGPRNWLIPALAANPLRNLRELISPNNAEAFAVAFTPNGTILIGATTDGLVFWSVTDSEILAYLPFSPPDLGANLPIDLVVSPDGALIALGRQDGLIHIFAVIEENAP